MAIDSRLKRQSVLAVSRPFLVPSVTPDSEEPVVWRQTSGWSYSGIPVADVSITLVYPIDKTWCFSRRGERDLLSCLRRSDESILALRRPPECPDELACPVGGCT
jgi:hypothetical protein